MRPTFVRWTRAASGAYVSPAGRSLTIADSVTGGDAAVYLLEHGDAVQIVRECDLRAVRSVERRLYRRKRALSAYERKVVRGRRRVLAWKARVRG